MERRITNKEIRYLLDHLAPLYSGADLGQFLHTTEGPDEIKVPLQGDTKNGPVFLIPSSEQGLDPEGVIKIEDIPVLFPCSEESRWYGMEGSSIRFYHDILKSAFYLLSGYQEYKSENGDEYGRFPWEASIQYKLGFTGIPVVNYYFEVILEAFSLFCQKNKLPFARIEKESPLLFLSHDVDRIKKFSFRNMVYMALQLPGIIASEKKLPARFWMLVDYTLGFLLQGRDPYWNFSKLMVQEESLGIKSTWFFLEKTGRKNSRYHFRDTKIKTLIGDLGAAGHEIGIHGTMESSENLEVLAGEVQRLSQVYSGPVEGIRQHFLRYRNPLTPRIQEQQGLLYDATLGFAGQIGFRNSYAGPFRLYDFDKQQSREIWQLPLNVMDVSLLNYMKLSPEEIGENVQLIVDEVARFKGVFGLLWHNCNLDEDEFPGVNLAYEELLHSLLEAKFAPKTGGEIIRPLKSAGA